MAAIEWWCNVGGANLVVVHWRWCDANLVVVQWRWWCNDGTCRVGVQWRWCDAILVVVQ